jgi:hypothetical protein
MPTTPLVSIVLPTYNGARYLKDAIESCLCQTYQNWELIVVDDASSDDTPRCIAAYAARDRRIQTVRNTQNKKLPGSLNTGFSRAHGSFLTWTSDDNCYRPDALREMVDCLLADPSVDIVYASYSLIDERGSLLPRSGSAPCAGAWQELPCRNTVGACFLYRQDVHQQLGGYAEDLHLVEDYDFWLRASTRFRLAWLNKDLYLYRWHEGSLTSTQPQRIRQAREKCLARNLPRMRWVSHQVRGRVYRDMVLTAMDRQDRLSAWRHLLRAVRSDPARMTRWACNSLPYLLLPTPLYRLINERDEWQWIHRFHLARHELQARIPKGASVIIVDEAQLGNDFLPGRRSFPFLEKEGQYWGPPLNDEIAIQELERLRTAGASFIAFVWPAFWWLHHYEEFQRHLQANFRRVLNNARLMVFDLRAQIGHCESPTV